MISRIRVTNFRSFDELDIELGDFSVLIGRNASGKSNFIDILRFLRDIEAHGLKNAVSMQGGAGFIRNTAIASSRNMSVEVVCNRSGRIRRSIPGEPIGLRLYRAVYSFELAFNDPSGEIEILHDQIQRFYKVFELEDEDEWQEKSNLGIATTTVSSIGGTVTHTSDRPEGCPDISSMMPFFTVLKEEEEDLYQLPPQSLLLGTVFFATFPFPEVSFEDIPIFDLDPRAAQRSTPITGRSELEEDGSNVAIALKSILEKEEQQRKLSNLVSEILPFVDDIKTTDLMDSSQYFALRERHTADKYLPASLLSDGTICAIAIVIALYFEERPLVVFEEPDRNFHPFLVSRIVEMMREVAPKRQIIVTTHSPQVVEAAGLDNILLVSRGPGGFSVISRPADRDDVRIFLENEIGLADIYAQGLLD